MAKRKKGKYSRTPRKQQLANKRARDRRYRANARQLAEQRANPDARMHDGDMGPTVLSGFTEVPSVPPPDPADLVDAAAEKEVDDAIAKGELGPPMSAKETIAELRAGVGRSGDDGGNPVSTPPRPDADLSPDMAAERH